MEIKQTFLLAVLLTAATASAQSTFTVTGTAVPSDLLKLSYGTLPKSIQGYDINVCNTTLTKHPLTSSQIYQALIRSRIDLRPIGRQLMLSVILRNQNHSLRTWLNLGLQSATGVLSVLGPRSGLGASRALSSAGLAALVGRELLTTWDPVLTADQVEKFEAQVLEPALVMDGGSCVERTIFTTVAPAVGPHAVKPQMNNLRFEVK